MSLQCPVDLLVDVTVAGTAYRKLFSYDITNITSLKALKSNVLDDLKAAGAPLETHASELVLRNYTLSDYARMPFNSIDSRSCAFSDQESWTSAHSKDCRLLSAEPSPQVPIGPADESRHAMLAIASRQIYDRAYGGGSVLPLEARVKPLAPAGLNATAAAATAGQAADFNDGPSAPASSSNSNSRVEPDTFDIHVRDFRGRCHMVRVCAEMSISRLKAGIAAALGCSVFSHWRLMHDGRPLDDELDLADYSVSPGALIEVQMTSQKQQFRTKTSGAISALTIGEGKEGNSSVSSTTKAVAAGGAAAPNCSAPWAIPVLKSAAASSTQILVQVLLPRGCLMQVPRNATEDMSNFICRVLEAEKALLAPPPPLPPAAAPAPCSSPSGALRARVLPGLALPLPDGPSAPTTTVPLRWDSNVEMRRRTRQLKGVVLGHKLLAVLLAAAAVVMALAVL